MEFLSLRSSNFSRHTVVQAWLADVVAAGEPLIASSSSSSTPHAPPSNLYQDSRPEKRLRPLAETDYSPRKRQRALYPVKLNMLPSGENQRLRSSRLIARKNGTELHQSEIENRDVVENLTKEEAPRIRSTTVATRVKRSKALPTSTSTQLKPCSENPQSGSIESRLTLNPNYEKLAPFNSELHSEPLGQSSLGLQYTTALASAPVSGDGQSVLLKSISSGAASSRRPRSTSPAKRMADLQFADVRMCYREFEDVGSQLPDDASQIYNDLDAFGQGMGVVPLKIKSYIREATKREKVFSVAFVNSDDKTTEEQLLKEFREVVDIQAASRTCAQDHDSEPAWNDEVHSRVLRMALHSKTGVGYKNITTARIQPSKLIPRHVSDHVSGQSVESKMVDYAIYLFPDKAMEAKILSTLCNQSGDSQSINQTMYDSLRQRPIAISIETKIPDASEEDAKVQLTIWASAQFARLRSLVDMSNSSLTETMTLPLLYVVGADWYILFAIYRTPGLITVYGKLRIGHTDTLLGVYKLICALQRLADWVTKVFSPWLNLLLSANRSILEKD